MGALRKEFQNNSGITSLEYWLEKVSKDYGISRVEAKHMLQKEVPKESYYQKKIKDALKTEYPEALVVKVAQAHFSEPGLPDLMCVIKGHYFGIEVKRPLFGKLAKTQGVMARRIERAGGTPMVVSFPEEAINIIKEYFNNVH